MVVAVTFLTVLIAASAEAAPARKRTARPAAPAPLQPAQTVQKQEAADATLAPPAQEQTIRPSASDSDEAGTLPERIDVQSMKRRYWTVGNEDLMDVVQNRLYTKKGRLEAALRYGFWSDDPFISQKSIGVSLGYHLNEIFSIHGFFASLSSANNQAWEQARQAAGVVPDTNPEKSVMGAEARASLLYGKLSLLGKRIFYYDFNLAGGLSQHKATVGSSMGFFLGAGQQFFVTRNFFLTFDYRMLFHTDKFPHLTPPYSTDRTRSLTTNWLQLGVGLFF
jgi:outer membrane beta-barrel protein